MKTSKTLERRAFLASTAAVVANVAGCSDDGSASPIASDGGSTEAGAADSTPSSGSDAGASSGSDSTNRDAAAASDPSTSSNPAATSTPADASASSSDGADASVSEASSSAADAAPTDPGETSSTSSASSAQTSEEPPVNDACFEGGGTDGGLGDDAGPGVLYSTNTFNGNHCHALLIPVSDQHIFDDRTYVLEDGGTGHTHTLLLNAYDFLPTEPGVSQTFYSSYEEGHSHACIVTYGE